MKINLFERAIKRSLRRLGLTVVKEDIFHSIASPGPLDVLVRLNIECNSVLHIGGHFAEEAETYRKAGVRKAVFVEGDPQIYTLMQKILQNYPDFSGICALLSNKKESVKFNIASNSGSSSSILFPERHLINEPNITFEKSVILETSTLDSLGLGAFDLVVLDVQGAELLVIEGGMHTINQAQALWIEVNAGSMYKGDASSAQIVTALADSFVPVFMSMNANLWGDALFIRKPA